MWQGLRREQFNEARLHLIPANKSLKELKAICQNQVISQHMWVYWVYCGYPWMLHPHLPLVTSLWSHNIAKVRGALAYPRGTHLAASTKWLLIHSTAKLLLAWEEQGLFISQKIIYTPYIHPTLDPSVEKSALPVILKTVAYWPKATEFIAEEGIQPGRNLKSLLDCSLFWFLICIFVKKKKNEIIKNITKK